MYRPGVLARGFSAHVMAEAMLSAPLMVGSLELLFNPTGARPAAVCAAQEGAGRDAAAVSC